MQTLLVYARTDLAAPSGSPTGLQRVESYYARLWPAGWARRGRDEAFGGMHLWDVPDPVCRWPSWSEDSDAAVATLYVPLGYQRLVGDVPPQSAPLPLAHSLVQQPEGMLELTPPTVLARMGKEDSRLDLWTDALGIGRMFSLRTADGWVWSNRPEAACLFAGVPARPDPMGWRYHAATDWFMGETSPIESVGAVPAATHVTVSAGRAQPVISRIDPSAVFAGPRRVDLEGVADALRDAARSVAAIWPGTPTLDLTGGRDSRVVAAAFLSAGVDVRLHTHNAVPGEVEAAQHLVGLLKQDVPHDIRQVSARRAGARPTVVAERVERWHRYSGGLRPSTYLAHTPPASLLSTSTPAIGGGGGELAHGFYYPPTVLKIDALPVTERLPAYRDHLQRRLLPLAGPTDATRAEAAAQMDRVLRTGLSLGLSDASLLDFFYADERLRRWGTVAERSGVISPLLTPAFVRAALALRPQDRLDAALHKGVLAHLIPAWAEVPFFKPTPGRPVTAPAGPPPAPFRLGRAIDADQLDQVFSLPSRWAADMDHRVIRDLWAASRAGRSTTDEELVLWRVTWRDLFHDYLAETLSGPADRREAVRAVQAPPRSSGGTRARANDMIRQAARTRTGRALRRTRVGGEVADQLRRHGLTGR